MLQQLKEEKHAAPKKFGSIGRERERETSMADDNMQFVASMQFAGDDCVGARGPSPSSTAPKSNLSVCCQSHVLSSPSPPRHC